MLAIVAGGGIGFGALYYTIVASDPDAQLRQRHASLGGLVFTLGLALVLVGGAELFTGNNLIVMAWASGKVSTRDDAAQLDHRLFRQLRRSARAGCSRLLLPSSRHE